MSSMLKGDLAPKSNKTPYELRLEILHLAQHIVDRENENKLQLIHLLADRDEELPMVEEKRTEEEILSIARKLNDFVSNG